MSLQNSTPLKDVVRRFMKQARAMRAANDRLVESSRKDADESRARLDERTNAIPDYNDRAEGLF